MSTGLSEQIREHMDVIASDGHMVGKVDHLEGDHIKLTKNDSPDGKHHTISTGIVSKVDQHVHLSQPADQVRSTWGTV